MTPAKFAEEAVARHFPDLPSTYAHKILLAAEDAARAAQVAEREANAMIAIRLGDEVEVGPGGDCGQGCQGIAQEIAAAIRARGDSSGVPAQEDKP